ncbi:MAG: glycosyltransferase family 4 protein [Pseudomonadota bacterium]
MADWVPDRIHARDVEVLAPNFKRRLSGVTSTIVQLIPRQRQLGVKIAAIGSGLPEGLPRLRWTQLPGAWKAPAGGRLRVWHARRNNEMLVGIVLRDVLRMPLKLIFTSAAQRNHKPFTRWLIARMDHVVSTSARSGAFLEVPHTTILHGIDTQAFHPPSSREDEIAATGLPGRYLVGCFGRIRHQKGTDLFVRAMIKLLPDYPDWTAVIAGRVTSEHRAFADTLKAEVTASGLSDRIVFLGEVPDVKVWYRRITLYVTPSRNEGFGLTPFEAMASLSAVVASDAGAYPEIIVPGETGDIVPAGDGDALTRAIKPYFADPDKAIDCGRKGLIHVRENFDLVREASALKTVYDRLLGHSPAT